MAATAESDPKQNFQKWLLRLVDTQQMRPEKCNDRGVEVLVEGCPIKARSDDANPGNVLHFRAGEHGGRNKKWIAFATR